MFTLNQPEIPTPFSGQGLLDQGGARIKLSKELLGDDCKVVELKVIAVTEGKMPSEVAYRKYEIREGMPPKPVNEDPTNAIIAVVGIQAN